MGVHTGITWHEGDDVVSADITTPNRTDGTVTMRLGSVFADRSGGSIALTGDPATLLDAAVQIAQIAVSRFDGNQPGAAACRADDLASIVGRLLATVDRADLEPAFAANIARNLSATNYLWAKQAPPSGFTKYRVERTDRRDRPGGDRAGAAYFVLDYTHDPYAREALEAYADACEHTHPTLASDLRERLQRERDDDPFRGDATEVCS